MLSSSRIDFRRSIKSIVAVMGVTFVGIGCSGPQKYKHLRENPEVITRRWVMDIYPTTFATERGTEYSNAAIYQNTLIFGTYAYGLTALYPDIFQRRWELPIPHGVTSEIAVDQSSVYFGGGDGFFYSVNADTGRINWKYELKDPYLSRPTIHGGRVFVTSSKDVVWAFDAGTGKWLWHYRRTTSQMATILGASQPLVDGNEVIVGLTDGFLVALSLDEGQLRWERRLHFGTKFTDVHAHPVLDNGVLYIPSYDGALYALKRQTGEVIWKFDAGGSKNVVIDNQRLFLPSSDGNVYCLQKSNAKVIWKFELDGGVPTNLSVTDQHVIVGSSYEYFYVADKEKGVPLSRFDVGYDSGFYGSPLYDAENRKIYTLSSFGNLYSFQLKNRFKD